ncbi:uncharacterized protein LOC127131756 [Lathyrus oleraceus]|uniref:uncharacterized protein LOC127131756 n=1 Tax=Pisum sativum TaxID=3888 RepID=UPI0021CF14A9|nr:uncharacterized protein LOC127131756 [Pisum sativum]
MDNYFKLKPSLIDMVQQNQFDGLPSKNLNLHLSIFVDKCGTVKANGVEQNAIRLRLFPFSLRDRVWDWLQSVPTNYITSYTQLKRAFHVGYFSPNAASSGDLMNSPQDVAYNLIEEMAKNHRSQGSVRQVVVKSTPKTGDLNEINVFDHMNDKVDDIYQKIDILSISPSIPVTHAHDAFVSPFTL